ncbi:hypothetical protein BOTBODRAFT_33368 [Botryobasidium botryosum FD-172 SS1]|uniref:Amino acid permease/ SLC12A domain-containing protein n=1 Tax=Botryobasidium botryosum (strain FD-172 SS1) TaxID=930990 RepID=A0A067MDM5_BOTB1|nr:hypothetical protein BOTBODRAFT_33368 [Botryobasidium botryosum FD-172 SS1]
MEGPRPDSGLAFSDSTTSPKSQQLAPQTNEQRPIASEVPTRAPALKKSQQFTTRTVIMTSISLTIGTGLFLGTSDDVWEGGPAGVLIGYAIMAFVAFGLVVSAAEMAAYYPDINGGIVGLIHCYGHPTLAFASGWLSWYHWALTGPSHIASAVTALGFYGEHRHNALFITIFLGSALVLNVVLSPRPFGLAQSAFASIKVLTIVLLVIFGLVYDLGGVRSQKGVRIGFKYWSRPGPIPHYLGIPGSRGQFLGFLQITMQATYSFLGCEFPIYVARLVEDIRDAPGKLTRAATYVWSCVAACYIFTVFVMGMIIPYNDPSLLPKANNPGTTTSAFITVMQRASVKVLPQIINAVFIISALSSASVNLFLATRYLYFMACLGYAPYRFMVPYEYSGVGNSQGRPAPDVPAAATAGANHTVEAGVKLIVRHWALLFSFLTALSAYASTIPNSQAQKAFSGMSEAAATAGLLSWTAIMYTYVRWYRVSGANRPEHKVNRKLLKKLRYNRLQPYLAYSALTICVLVLIFNGWACVISGFTEGKIIIAEEGDDPVRHTHGNITMMQEEFPRSTMISTLIAIYIPIPIFLLFAVGYNLIDRVR